MSSNRFNPELLKIKGFTENEDGTFSKRKAEFEKYIDTTQKYIKEMNENHPEQFYKGGSEFEVTFKADIEITVLGDPKAQKRHRHARMGNMIKTYDPSSTDKGDFLSVIQNKAPEKPFDCPLMVEAEFYFSRPKNHFKTGKNSHLLKDNVPLWHTSRNDVDNLMKFVLDAMNKIYWRDDSIISSCTIKKQYSDNPRTEIKITKL